MNVPRLVCLAAAVLLASAPNVGAQPPGGDAGITFNSGQSVQPIYEGWTKNADGSFELHFGYLNRNYVQEIHVPLGPDNTFEPGGDRGQPTYFYPRYNNRMFSVTVPRDFGKREMIWTLNTNGRKERAVGWLQAEWEIAPANPGIGGGQSAAPPPAGESKNQPPKLTIATPGSASVGTPLTITATVADDGLPAAMGRGGRGGAAGGGGGRGGRGGGAGAGAAPGGQGGRGDTGGAGAAAGADAPAGGGRGAAAAGGGRGGGRGATGPPAFRRENPATTPVNVPQLEAPPPPRLPGLSVLWLVWRGPAGVNFNPRTVPVKDGQAAVSAQFAEPGEYVLRARASDGAAMTTQDTKVVVTGTAR